MSFSAASSGPTPGVVDALAEWLAADGEPEPIVVETSGSTGRPKRVRLSRRAVLASVAATSRRLGGDGPWVLALPVGYVAGLQVVCRSLVAGHRPVLLEDHPTLADAVVAAGGAPYISLVATQLKRRSTTPTTLTAPTAALAACRAVLVGGGPVDRAAPGPRRGGRPPRGGDLRLGGDRAEAASTTGSRSTAWPWRSASTGGSGSADPCSSTATRTTRS